MSTKTDQRIVNEMRAFAQGAKRKPLPQKQKQRTFEEVEYVADVSVRQAPKSRVVYTEDIIPDEPVKNKNKAHHRAPTNDPTANMAIANADREARERKKEEKRQGNGNNSHKPFQSNHPKVGLCHSSKPHETTTKMDKPKGNPKAEPIEEKQPLAVPSKKLPATSDTAKCVSKISNLIRNDLQSKDIFGELHFNGKHKMFPEPFYRKVGNTIYNSLLEFLNIERYQDGTDPETGRQIWDFNLPPMSKNIPHIGTWYFLDRAYHHNSVSWEKDVTLIEKYRRVFQDHDGIDVEWLENFRNGLKEKFFNLPNSGLNIIIDAVRETWCSNCETEPEEIVDATVLQVPTSVAEYIPDDTDDEELEELIPTDFGEDDDEEEEEEDDELDDDGEEIVNSLNVEQERYEGLDMITIIPRSQQSITFYVDLEQVDLEEPIPFLGSERNGIWDWLMHFVPNMIFRTMEPEKYISEGPEPVADTKIIILDDADGLFTMGVYYLDSQFGNELLEDGSENVDHRNFISKINNIVRREMGSSLTSHRNITLGMESLFWDEEDILEYVEVYHDNKDGISESDEEEEPTGGFVEVFDEVFTVDNTIFTDAINKAVSIASGKPSVPHESDDEDTSSDPEDDPPYPGDDPEEVEYDHDDASSDFMFKPVSRKNKYS